MAQTPQKKITVLALHGYGQNGDIMLSKIERLFRPSGNYKIFCPTGPFVPDVSTLSTFKSDSTAADPASLRGWWKLPSKDIFTQPHVYEKLDDTLDWIKAEIAAKRIPKEIDVLVGFSQGSVLATILIMANIVKATRAIMIASSDLMDPRFVIGNETIITENAWHRKINLPTLFISGAGDTLAKPFESEKLRQNRYDISTTEVYLHSQGHVIPSNGEAKQIVRQFLSTN